MADQLFLGIDLAWKAENRTGLAVVGDAGQLLASGAVVTDTEIAEWIAGRLGTVITVAVDAPLIVPNDTGQRVGEKEIGRAFGKYSASPHTSNRANPLFNPPRALTLAERFGWTVDPANRGSAVSPACIEVYPHPAMVGLFQLGERLLYKKGPERQRAFGDLMMHYESLTELRLTEHERWSGLKQTVANPMPGDFDRIEDELDAILCAHLAWLWHHRPDVLQVYGSLETGYIVAPPPPTHPATLARTSVGSIGPEPATSSRHLISLALDVVGRPTGFAAEANEQRWKAAVRAAFADASLPPLSRVAVEIEFRLGLDQRGRNAPDLDNLIKSTIDALERVLGPRPGKWKTAQADDERVDRIVATKRPVRGGETPGARVVVTELVRSLG